MKSYRGFPLTTTMPTWFLCQCQHHLATRFVTWVLLWVGFGVENWSAPASGLCVFTWVILKYWNALSVYLSNFCSNPRRRLSCLTARSEEPQLTRRWRRSLSFLPSRRLQSPKCQSLWQLQRHPVLPTFPALWWAFSQVLQARRLSPFPLLVFLCPLQRR